MARGFAELLSLGCCGFDALVLDVQAKTSKQPHISAGDLHDPEPGDHIAAPPEAQKAEKHDGDEKSRYGMTETVFAGEKIEKL